MVAMMNGVAARLIAGSFVAVIMAGSVNAQCPTASTVPFAATTYHYDNLRTGWNCNETQLTPVNVAKGFGLLHSVVLDDQVDAQPLFVPHLTITLPVPLSGGAAAPPAAQGSSGGTGVEAGKPSIFDVVYVATENNSIYAIDAATGDVLLQRNLGIPVGGVTQEYCGNNGRNVGINSTPVIDPVNNVMYVIAFTYEAPNFVYKLHELYLNTLNDVPGSPVVVTTAAQILQGGPRTRTPTTTSFSAFSQRQRPGLALVNGNVYAGFGSFCDNPGPSRGWLLGWNARSLVALPAQLNNFEATAQVVPVPIYDMPGATLFLASIWMSGVGVAADASNNLYFATGNSNSQYYPPVSIQESVVKLSPGLGATDIQGIFTPPNQPYLDLADEDFGSGGVMLLPDQPGSTPHLAVAAGKDGNMYLMNRDSLTVALGNYQIGGCWCGPSYFHTGGTGTNAAGHVVSSGGSQLDVWQVQTPSGVPPSLIPEYSTPVPTGRGDGGFMTSISSNGETGDAIIWAVPRPLPDPNIPGILPYAYCLWLYAFRATQTPNTVLTQIFKAPAGTWPYAYRANANIVPVVAAGKVFVASYGLLNIFGLGGAQTSCPNITAPGPPQPALLEVYGTIVDISGSQLTIQLRTGALLRVDATAAINSEHFAVVFPGRAIVALGTYGVVAQRTSDAKGLLTFHADVIWRAKPPPWPPDD